MTPRRFTPDTADAFRVVMRELDHEVATSEDDARSTPSDFTRAQRDAWRIAQQAVQRRFARLQLSSKE